jgi:DNA recombination protein RmuC
MFIPVEPVFLEIARREPDPLQEAWERRAMIVGPSTLQWALRTVASVWRFEHQNLHAHEIAEHAARLYDKFVRFIEELDKVGRRLNRATEAYGDAVKKLHTGRGNIVRQVTQLKEMGMSFGSSCVAEALAAWP